MPTDPKLLKFYTSCHAETCIERFGKWKDSRDREELCEFRELIFVSTVGVVTCAYHVYGVKRTDYVLLFIIFVIIVLHAMRKRRNRRRYNRRSVYGKYKNLNEVHVFFGKRNFVCSCGHEITHDVNDGQKHERMWKDVCYECHALICAKNAAETRKKNKLLLEKKREEERKKYERVKTLVNDVDAIFYFDIAEIVTDYVGGAATTTLYYKHNKPEFSSTLFD